MVIARPDALSKIMYVFPGHGSAERWAWSTTFESLEEVSGVKPVPEVHELDEEVSGVKTVPEVLELEASLF